ncbi:MAG TPA: hypothetical protein VG916_08930, partial [Gemmatimonadaceae bacterium]|nr:hypothetical protein [Gemmatimonadaceae bacterium]
MTRPSVVSLTVLAAVAAVAACDFSTGDTAGSPYGVGLISTQGSAGAYTMSPAIAFYRVSGATLVNSAVTRDTCVETTYSPAGDTIATTAPALSAGAFIVLGVSGRTDTLRHSNTADPYYRSSGAIPFSPGDSMTIAIPGDGNGFPASSFKAGTAE